MGKAKTQPAKFHLKNMVIDAVRIVSRGANGRDKWILAKTADEAPVEGTFPQEGTPELTGNPAPVAKVQMVVAKAITLNEGETLQDFMCGLGGAFRKHTNPADVPDKGMYLRAVFEDNLIAERWADSTMWKFDWARKGDEFTFGDAVEVKEKVTFEVLKATSGTEVLETEQPAPLPPPPIPEPVPQRDTVPAIPSATNAGGQQPAGAGTAGAPVAPAAGAPGAPPAPGSGAGGQPATPTQGAAVAAGTHTPAHEGSTPSPATSEAAKAAAGAGARLPTSATQVRPGPTRTPKQQLARTILGMTRKLLDEIAGDLKVIGGEGQAPGANDGLEQAPGTVMSTESISLVGKGAQEAPPPVLEPLYEDGPANPRFAALAASLAGMDDMSPDEAAPQLGSHRPVAKADHERAVSAIAALRAGDVARHSVQAEPDDDLPAPPGCQEVASAPRPAVVKGRRGTAALAVEGPSEGSQNADPWSGVTDLAEEFRRHRAKAR